VLYLYILNLYSLPIEAAVEKIFADATTPEVLFPKLNVTPQQTSMVCFDDSHLIFVALDVEHDYMALVIPPGRRAYCQSDSLDRLHSATVLG
jgi:hypothetical protein